MSQAYNQLYNAANVVKPQINKYEKKTKQINANPKAKLFETYSKLKIWG